MPPDDEIAGDDGGNESLLVAPSCYDDFAWEEAELERIGSYLSDAMGEEIVDEYLAFQLDQTLYMSVGPQVVEQEGREEEEGKAARGKAMDVGELPKGKPVSAPPSLSASPIIGRGKQQLTRARSFRNSSLADQTALLLLRGFSHHQREYESQESTDATDSLSSISTTSTPRNSRDGDCLREAINHQA